MKKLSFIFFYGLLCTATMSAQTWNCGYPNETDVIATLSAGTINISGTGAMADYSPSSPAPWYDVRAQITQVSIGGAVTGIGNYAFSGCENLESLLIPNNVTYIGKGILLDCGSLAELTLPFVGKSATATGNDALLGYFFDEPAPFFLEDFEEGNGETLPGWTIINGSQINKWYAGTATANGGSRSMYISDNAADNTYASTTSSVVHFCRNFDIVSTAENPAMITFDWKGQGSSGNHFLLVYVESAGGTPEAGSYGTSYLVQLSMGGASWNRQTIYLPVMSGARRVQFTWRNNFMEGTQPPVAVDNFTISTPSAAEVHPSASLKKLTISSPCTTIPDHAFRSFNALEEIVLPETLTAIGAYAFAGCRGLTAIKNHAVFPMNVLSDLFDDIDKTACTLYVPNGYSMSLYRVADVWGEFTNIAPITLQAVDASLASVLSPSSGFNLTASEEVTVLIENLGANPLSGFELKLEFNGAGVATETFAGSIPSLGKAEHTFAATLDLSAGGAYQIKVTVTAAGDETPDNDSKTKTVWTTLVCDTPVASGEYGALPWALCEDGTLTIAGAGGMEDGGNPPWESFNEQIRKVVIADGVTSIGENAFGVYSNLSELSIANTVEKIGDYAFVGCNISFVIIPDGVKYIGNAAFGKGNATDIVIPASVTEIARYAFVDNPDLQEISVSWDDPADVMVDNDCFAYVDKESVLLHVPVGTKAAYEALDVWKDFNIVEDGLIHVNFLLKDLTVSAGKLSPAFAPNRYEYRVSVPQSAASIVLTAVPFDGDASVSGVGQKQLITGENSFEITVTKSGQSRAYTVVITRRTNDLLLDVVSSAEIETGATTISHFSAVINANETHQVIDRFEMKYVLTTGNFSGNLPLHFDFENGRYTYDREFSVEANSLYEFTLFWMVSYSQFSNDITFTTHYENGQPSYETMSYRRHNCDVIASDSDDAILTSTLSITGSSIFNIGVSNLTYIGAGSIGTSYTVTFDTQGGSDITSQTVADGGNVTQPANPTRKGFTFDGWYKEAACTNAWNFDTDVVTEDITLYAKWTQGGTGTEDIFAAALKIYPNPFTDVVYITGAAVETGHAPSLRVINIAGAVVHTQIISSSNETIRLGGLPAGVYFFRLEKEGRTKTIQVVKN